MAFCDVVIYPGCDLLIANKQIAAKPKTAIKVVVTLSLFLLLAILCELWGAEHSVVFHRSKQINLKRFFTLFGGFFLVLSPSAS